MQQTIKHIFSTFSGTFYEILEKDVSLLIMGQLPLTKKPNSSCKKCFGRGYIGRDIENLGYYPCNCVKKAIDMAEMKKMLSNTLELDKILK
jgi:hypothetical protein